MVTWTAPDDPETGTESFRIYLDGVPMWTVAGTWHGAYLSAPPAGEHRIRVDATNKVGMTTAGAETLFQSVAAPRAPDPPTVTATTHGESLLGGEVTLDWPALTGADLAAYALYVDETLVGTVDPGTTRYPLGMLATGGHYARVVAVDPIGWGASSVSTYFWVDASPPPAPPAPLVKATTSYGGILRGPLQISWPSVEDIDSSIASYRVFVDHTLVPTPTAGSRQARVDPLPTGTHEVRVDAVNGAGLTATGAIRTIRVDASSPVLSAPTVTLRPGAAGAGTPVTITASAVDTDAGVCTISATVDGRPVGTASGAALRVNAAIPAGGKVTVRVTATDCVGNTATVSKPVTVATTAETAARYSKGWGTRRSNGYAGRTEKVSRRAGATATYTFTGSQVAWTGSRATTTGAVTVYLDGKRVATVDTRGRSAPRQLLWATTTRYGRHTLKVVVRGTPRRPAVALDGFVTLR
jgi:hypothetical protein